MGNVWRGRGNGIEEKKEGLAAFQKLKFHYTFNYTSFFAFCFFCFFLFGCFLFFFFFFAFAFDRGFASFFFFWHQLTIIVFFILPFAVR